MAFSWKDVFCDPDLRSQVLDPLARDGAVEAIGALFCTCRGPANGSANDLDALGRATVELHEARYAMAHFAGSGSLRLVQWGLDNVVLENDLSLHTPACTYAADRGHLEILQFLHQHGFPWNTIVCENAAEGGHLEVLQWLRANGCPWDGYTCSSAARSGHLEVLKWARSNDCPWDGWTCASAARYGHLEVLQWASANGCPWNVHTCAYAALDGHLEVIQWARANGCPWDSDECLQSAESYGHTNMAQWIRENYV
jgi:hypothetical protein